MRAYITELPVSVAVHDTVGLGHALQIAPDASMHTYKVAMKDDTLWLCSHF